ncbi:hypothetical protein FOF46_17480 [Aquimarina algiphila]|uniref:YCII-related domain-containing protein n=2 Tax=Aquimarina algiphila TaxID=2047982 RepID=A0A554VHK5_9FLAO|nr:hypothetical protein [Aquimarina algiphila]TSE07013.1 hypothetical protein FOF46_17480 [Aquimarina algiphila]
MFVMSTIRTSLIPKLFGFLMLIVSISCQQQPKEQHVEKIDTIVDDVESIKHSARAIKEQLLKDGFEIFDYVDEESGDTVIMQQYFIAFLKRGPNRSQSKEEADSLQKLHLGHLGKMYKEGFADISGPFGDDGDIRGITIYNTPTQQMADSLANMDPMVKSGRLIIEIHPWWAAKGFPLR